MGLRRTHRVHEAIGEASPGYATEDEFEHAPRQALRTSNSRRETLSYFLPDDGQFASRRLIAALASEVKDPQLVGRGTGSDCLISLVALIFDDLMIGADAKSAVTQWRQSRAADLSLGFEGPADRILVAPLTDPLQTARALANAVQKV